MTTKLTREFKREVALGGRLLTVTISPEGVRIAPKGFRQGYDWNWRQLADPGLPPPDYRTFQSPFPATVKESR